MGYNLAIEYLADYEKTWMLDSFREVLPGPVELVPLNSVCLSHC